MLDWLRICPEIIRLNLQKASYRRHLAGQIASSRSLPRTAPCQCPSDSGRPLATRCEACLRFDSAARYRFVCRDATSTADGVVCARDSADIRPDWRRLSTLLVAIPALGILLAVLGTWIALRFGTGLHTLPLVDVAWPPRWAQIAEHRRTHFHALTLDALAKGDVPATTIALFTAAHTGVGDPVENIALARLATLGGFHGLADEIHTANLAAHPADHHNLALAWHEDLLIANRPLQLARLSINRLSLPDSNREFWLGTYLTAIRHPGVAAAFLALDPPVPLPHQGLRAALDARAALDRGDAASASDDLLALRGNLPGEAARRFLALSWLDARAPARARAAALETSYPAPHGEIALLSYLLLRADTQPEPARAVLRPLLAEPALHSAVLATLIQTPDTDLVRELAASLTPAQRTQPRLLSALWLASRRAGLTDLATDTEKALAALGQPLPASLVAADLATPATVAFQFAANLLLLDREVLQALRQP
jgi:hypothetical protein